MQMNEIKSLFNWDPLACLMITLVLFIGLVVGSFASRYMKGDSCYKAFFLRLVLLLISLVTMLSADNLILVLISRGLGNILLIKLMIHKSNWLAARASGILAAKTFLLGFIFISTSFALLYVETGETSVQQIILHHSDSPLITFALILLTLGAMTQSAIWPFHKWLLSSLNSPLPVSAIMHAGLVNGGGILILTFAPLYFNKPALLNAIFIIGLLTGLVGTFWKLIQSDVKRMLACSTMAQMGFMMVQCGLGLFPAAVAHIFLHGLFKAYLFLASGSAAQEKRLDLFYPPSFLPFLCALLCGCFGAYGFMWSSGQSLLEQDSTLVLIAIGFIAASQFALSMLNHKSLKQLPLVVILTSFAGLVYGYNVCFFEWIVAPMELMNPQPLNFFYAIGIFLLASCWILILFKPKLFDVNWLYVKALNASQPHPETITAHRNHYKYL